MSSLLTRFFTNSLTCFNLILKLKALLLLLILLNVSAANSEPWIANKIAQNCAGCHAPGRLNRGFMERRCTLSCQGCHVNPNGGGIRNQYGQWTSQRWLKSIESPWLFGKAQPAPFAQQRYAQSEPTKLDSKEAPKPRTNKMAEEKKPFGGVEPYLKGKDRNWQTEVSQNDAEKMIPEDDPYWSRRDFLLGGFDFRYVNGNQKGTQITQEFEKLSFPMAFDVGVQARPGGSHLSFVVESRFSNGPTQSEWDYLFTSSGKVRSAYLLIDDLPMNSWIMYGLYRPGFGYYTADHTNLVSEISELDQNSVFKAVGFGTAPNVPYFNAHIITPMSDRGYNDASSGDKGFNVNTGLRFVTLGLSGQLSYWSTKRESVIGERKNDMYSGSLGIHLWTVLNFDYLVFDKTELDGSINKGSVWTLETKSPLWRENYLIANYSAASTASDRSEGKTTEYSAGFKLLLFAGSELDFVFTKRTETIQNVDVSLDQTKFLAHIYY